MYYKSTYSSSPVSLDGEDRNCGSLVQYESDWYGKRKVVWLPGERKDMFTVLGLLSWHMRGWLVRWQGGAGQ